MLKKSKKAIQNAKNQTNVNVCENSSGLSSMIMSAKEANDTFNKSLEKKRSEFRTLTSSEIAEKIKESIDHDQTFATFFNAVISDEDLKVLKDKGYSVYVKDFTSSASRSVDISWSDYDIKKADKS